MEEKEEEIRFEMVVRLMEIYSSPRSRNAIIFRRLYRRLESYGCNVTVHCCLQLNVYQIILLLLFVYRSIMKNQRFDMHRISKRQIENRFVRTGILNSTSR